MRLQNQYRTMFVVPCLIFFLLFYMPRLSGFFSFLRTQQEAFCKHLVQSFRSAKISFNLINVLSLGVAQATRPIPVICRAVFGFYLSHLPRQQWCVANNPSCHPSPWQHFHRSRRNDYFTTFFLSLLLFFSYFPPLPFLILNWIYVLLLFLFCLSIFYMLLIVSVFPFVFPSLCLCFNYFLYLPWSTALEAKCH